MFAELDILLYKPVCVGADRKPRKPFFSRRGSYHDSFEVLYFRATRNQLEGTKMFSRTIHIFVFFYDGTHDT